MHLSCACKNAATKVRNQRMKGMQRMLEILQEKKIAQTNNETKPMLQGRLSGLERIKTL